MLTKVEAGELIRISIEQISQNVVYGALEKVGDQLCRECSNRLTCGDFCNQAMGAAINLVNRYIVFKARYN